MKNIFNNCLYKKAWIIPFCLLHFSCTKYLDEKPQSNLVLPTKLADLQALLDNNLIMNLSSALGEGSADNYYLTTANWASLSTNGSKNVYTWGDELIYDNYPNDWSNLYMQVYYGNVVLEKAGTIAGADQQQPAFKKVAGSAYFFRGRAFHMLAVTWAKSYDPGSAATTLGIPLRLNSNFNEVSVRASLQSTYQQIVSDLENAAALLPVSVSHVMQPSKGAAYALLSRVFLSMRDYVNAGYYADSALRLNNTLLDYNSLSTTAAFPISSFNQEVLFHATIQLPQYLNSSRAVIDSSLYNSYQVNDLRKTIFFKSNGNGTYAFKGSYNNSIILFTGLANDEVYLNRAESYARNGNTASALSDLNTLLAFRYKKGSFIQATAVNAADALQQIQTERRKELLMRDTRWMDIKRLNSEGGNISLKRLVNNQVYELPANDKRFALPIPAYVIDMTGMPQN